MARPSTLWQSLVGPWRGPEYTATNHPQLRSGSSSSRRLQLELSSLSSQEAGALKRLDDLAPKLTAARQAELLRLECEHTANYIRLLRARSELARARESAAADSLGPVDTRSSDDLQRHAPGGEPAQTSTAACAASPTPSASCSSSGLPSSCGQGADQAVEQEGIEAQSRRVSELSSSTSALLAQMVAARRRAAALRQPSVREETLRDLLARARLAFDGGERLRLYAPMAEIQRRFEEVVCAPGSREARLFSSWVRHIAPHGHSGEPTTLDAATASEVTMGLCAMDCEPHLRGDACCRFRLLQSACYSSPSERRFGSVDQATGADSGVTPQSYGLSCVVTGHRFLCSPLDSQLGSLPSPSRSSLLPSVASSASRRSPQFSPSAESLFAASASSPAGGLLPSTVVDFISYFARVVAKTYHLEESVVAPATSRAGATADVASTRLPLLLPLEQCAARLVFSSAFSVLFPPIRMECACKDAAFLRQQRWMRMLPDAAIAGERRQDGPNGLAANSAGIGTTSVRLDQDCGDNADIRHTARSGDAAGAFRTSATADATASGPDTPATSTATAAHSPGSNETNPLAHFTTDGDATFGLAVGALSELSYATVPIDSLLCVMRAVRHLHESAAKATSIPVTAIGADLLQPLLVLAAVSPCSLLQPRPPIPSQPP